MISPLRDIRAGKPPFYPDQSIHAEYACGHLGLTFADIDGGTGLLFTVGRGDKTAAFGAGRGSFFPQNNATAATLANDKYFAGVVMVRAGVATLGGRYFFLHERHRALRPPGHERDDARAYLRELGGSAFVKPLNGSRGDFAQMVRGEAGLTGYLDDVARSHDAIIMQRVCTGQEYRVFVLDDDIVYCARKTPPVVTGDGRRSIGELVADAAAGLRLHGISSARTSDDGDGVSDQACSDLILPKGERRIIPGRTNRSAGGTMEFAAPDNERAAYAMVRQAMRALGLRAGAVDLFADIGGDPAAIRVIEVNANPSIRFLEDNGRDDLILRIWRHTFTAIGLLDV